MIIGWIGILLFESKSHEHVWWSICWPANIIILPDKPVLVVVFSKIYTLPCVVIMLKVCIQWKMKIIKLDSWNPIGLVSISRDKVLWKRDTNNFLLSLNKLCNFAKKYTTLDIGFWFVCYGKRCGYFFLEILECC